MANYCLSYRAPSVTLTLSPLRLGLEIHEARTLLASIPDEVAGCGLYYAFADVVDPRDGTYVPPPHDHATRVEWHHGATQDQAMAYLAEWEALYATTTLHEPL